jgi:hypothetical protein
LQVVDWEVPVVRGVQVVELVLLLLLLLLLLRSH